MDHSQYSRKLSILLLIVVIQWAVLVALVYDPASRSWTMFNPDSMDTLTMARSWVHGHPLRILPSDPPSTILSDLLSPLLFAPGHLLGFKTLSAFILWAYLVCLVLALVSTAALWSFFNRFLPGVAFPATLLCAVFPGIFDNLFSTNFGFLFTFFWLALASLHSFPRFAVFSLLASLLRPEGIVCYAFLVLVYASINGSRRLWRFAPGLLPLFIPHLVYRQLTGSFMPQGVVAQNLTPYQGIVQSLFVAAATAMDQIRGTLLGLHPSVIGVGSEKNAWLGALPPGVFVLALVGMARARPRESVLVLSYLGVLVIGDSFSRFSGIHYGRHLHLLTPFLVGYALQCLRELSARSGSIWGIGRAFLFAVVGFQVCGSLNVIRGGAKMLSRDREIVDHIKMTRPNLDILVSGSSIMYWGDGALKFHSHSVGTNPVLGKYVKYWMRHLEVSEYLQSAFPCSVLFLTSEDQYTIEDWLRRFQVEPSASFPYQYVKPRELMLLDLRQAADRPPYPEPHDELDVGDPLSELRCGYRFRDSLLRPVGSPLVQGTGFWDGGRPSVVKEGFRLEVPVGGGWLIGRYKGTFRGKVLELFDNSAVMLQVEQEEITITANGRCVFADTVRFSEGFSHLAVPLDVTGDVDFRIEGLFNSFHYWIYPRDAIGSRSNAGGETKD